MCHTPGKIAKAKGAWKVADQVDKRARIVN